MVSNTNDKNIEEMMLKNIALKLSFDGSCFHGWQFQENALSVQEALQNSWYQLTGEKVQMIGSSRTDSGVHAKGLIANFSTATSIPTNKIHLAINTVLPDGLAVNIAKEVPPDFNARFDSIGKHYSYYFFIQKYKPTFLRNMVALINQDLNLTEMYEAIPYLIGEKDFNAFMDQGSPVKNTVRTIHGINLKTLSENILEINVFGDGFLYHMVRIIAGTLLYVGNGKIKKEDLPFLIADKDRKKLGKTMPAQGLFLNRVYFQKELFGDDSQEDFLKAASQKDGDYDEK